jgi:hypothetical protein
MSRLARGSRLRLVFPFASIALWLASLFLTAFCLDREGYPGEPQMCVRGYHVLVTGGPYLVSIILVALTHSISDSIQTLQWAPGNFIWIANPVLFGCWILAWLKRRHACIWCF